jgi:C-8 sterol isomerase
MPNLVFDPEIVHACALKSLGLPKAAMLDAFADAMEERYPGVLDRTQPWVYSIAGGAMIQIKLYYASIFEYVMIWGTPIGSEGHSGRHRSGFWDTVIDGEMWYFAEGELERRVYKPGDRVYVGPGQACGMKFTDGVWAVEYQRGLLPASVPFGLADELLSCLDVQTAAQTLSLYTDLVCQHYGRTLGAAPGPFGPAAKLATSVVGGAARKVTDWLKPPPTVLEMPRDNPRW